ncbi:MAG: anthranilate phosphoribosyltransferase [Alphaproteobacteria bacterium]|nr:anthranilate phosphoribosyltransferase [Alphaproteobacteria bacterium]MBV9693316.1 anthranilate phosphoribosyltransferase [Alphaproteobacteria bacterium]
MNALFARVIGGTPLDAEDSAHAFDVIMSGHADPVQVEAFLAAQAARGPTVDELIGAAQAMRARMLTIEAPAEAVDLCGTGGDGQDTLNISTAVSFVVAGAGIPVAKHGNRGASSHSGAADVLAALGVKIELEPRQAEACLRRAGLCFLFAQRYHPAMRHVAEIRKRIKSRTIFNLLGPICNPARVRRQLIGVFAPEWLAPFAEVLAALGADRAWIVHGADGLDELSTTGDSLAFVMQEGARVVRPEDAGIARGGIEQIRGGDASFNAAAIRRLLGGERDAYRDIVLLNAAATLIVAGRAAGLAQGAALAAEAIDSGAAQAALDKLIETSNMAP